MNQASAPFRRAAASCGLLALLATANAEPYAASLDRLEGALKQRVQVMSEGAQTPPPSTMSAEHVMDLCFLAVAVILAWPLVLRAIQRRQEAPADATAAEGEPELLYMKEPTLASFLEQLSTGAVQPLTYGNHEKTNETNPLTTFLESAPAEILKLQTLLVDASRATDSATRRKKLLGLLNQYKTLNYNACQIEMVQTWRMAMALADLLKQLSKSETCASASGIHTVAESLKLFRTICTEQIIPPLDKDSPAKLLVVTGDTFCRAALTGALKKAFFHPDTAADAATCLALAAQQTYDVIYVDMEMPAEGALALCETIRGLERNRTTPLVLLTPHDDLEKHFKKASDQNQQLLGKPFLFVEVLVQALTLVLGIRMERGTETTNQAAAKPGTPTKRTPAPASLPAAETKKPTASKPAESQPATPAKLVCATP